MDRPVLRKTVTKSIIREVKRSESSESDCISDDEHNHRNSSILSPNINVPTQTAIVKSCTDMSCNNNNISLDYIDQNLLINPSQSSYISHKYQYTNREQHHLPSPNLHRKKEKYLKPTIAPRRSRSLNNLSHSVLTEKDSGTGESLVHLPIPVSPKPIHYEIVPVFGQKTIALMANRYEFDPKKIDEYRERTNWKPFRKPFTKAPRAINPIIESTPKPVRRDTNNNVSTTKIRGITSFFVKTTKSSPIDRLSIEPITRHHSSQSRFHIDDNY